MTAIKMEVEGNYLSCDNSCFICLQTLIPTENQHSSLKFLFNYLKISIETQELFACEKCEKNIVKVGKLSNHLEKVRLEMDYLLGIVQTTILNSKGVEAASWEITCVREQVMKKCKKKISYTKPQVILQRMDCSKKNFANSSDFKSIKSIKMEIGESSQEDVCCDNTCLICLQSVFPTNQETLKSIHFFLSYLKIRDNMKSIVCNKCEDNLTKFKNLASILEKISLERDYLLESLRCKILNSKKEFKLAPLGPFSVRESIVIKCEDQICKIAKILLQRIDTSQIKARYSSACNILPDSNEDDEDASTPIISEVKHVKLDLEDQTTISGAKCPTCSKIFVSELVLKRHMDAVHLGLRPYQCGMCDKYFAYPGGVQHHIKTAHLSSNSLKTFKCLTCPKSFSERHNLRRHIDMVHRRLKPLKCSECNRSFYDSCNLRAHIDIVHLRLKSCECDLCGKSFSHAGALARHKANVIHDLKPSIQENIKLFPCEICDKPFDNLHSLKLHKMVHSERKFICNFCEKAFKRGHHLKGHISSVHEKQRHYCQVNGCDTNYSHASELLVHYRLKHPDFKVDRKSQKRTDYFKVVENGETLFECKVCARRYKSSKYVKVHIDTVHGSKTKTRKFHCGDCDYKAGSRSNLNEHIKRWHKPVNFVECHFCKKQIRSTTLPEHIRLVHGEKKFKCLDCSYSTAALKHFKVHIKRKHQNKRGLKMEEDQAEVCVKNESNFHDEYIIP